MSKKRTGLFPFILAVMIIIVVLKVLNWVPSVLEKGGLRQYAGVDEARAALNMKDILVPSYFPQQIVWPPSAVLAQTKPYPAIVMKFTRANKRDTALVVSQSQGAAINNENPIDIVTIRETVRYALKGRDAVLTVGMCRHEEPCSGITWKEDASTITVQMKSGPFELIRIAESMIR